jgi:hypothetical protein
MVGRPIEDFMNNLTTILSLVLFSLAGMAATPDSHLLQKNIDFFKSDIFLQNARKDQVSIISKDQLSRIIDFAKEVELDKQEEFKDCEKRAAILSIKLEKDFDIRTGNIWVKGDLAVPTRRLPLDGFIRWSWHIAPYVLVKELNGKTVPYSLDFSLSDKPIMSADWLTIIATNSDIEKVSQRNRFDDAILDASTESQIPKSWRYDQESVYLDYIDGISRNTSMFDRSMPEREDAAIAFLASHSNQKFSVIINASEIIQTNDQVTPGIFDMKLFGKQTRCLDPEDSISICQTYVVHQNKICYFEYSFNNKDRKTLPESEATFTCYGND